MEVINPKKIEKIESFFKQEISENIDSSNTVFPDVVDKLLEKSKQDSLEGKVLSHKSVINEAREKYKLPETL